MPLNQKILVIDDDLSFATLVKQFLEHRSFSVLISHDGTSALREIQDNKPDLIVLDLGLPDMYCGELLARPALAGTRRHGTGPAGAGFAGPAHRADRALP